MKELGDRGAQGRACGNLGNTHYLIGNFELAIMFHEEVGVFFFPSLHISIKFQSGSKDKRVMPMLSQVAPPVGGYPSFHSMKQLGVVCH